MRVPVLSRFTKEAPLSAIDVSNLARHLAIEKRSGMSTAEHNTAASNTCPNCNRKNEPSSRMCWCGYRLQAV